MAGYYFYDPRPFYMQPGDYKLISLDDCFVPQKGQGGGGKGEGAKGEGGGKGKGGGGGDGGGEGKGKEKEKEGDGNKKKDEKPKVQTIELWVNLCCDNCVSKVHRKLQDVEGVEKVDCCQWTKRVTVKGTVKPEVVLKRVRKVRRDAELITPPKK